jgi:phospholipase C
MNIKRLAACCAAASLLLPMSAGANLVRPEPLVRRPAVEQTSTVAELRSHVKYVFVIYQENRSFDSYFGTYPGAEGIYSHRPSDTLGYTQQLEDTNGNMVNIRPFKIGPAQYAADTDDVDHSHYRLIAKMDVTSNGPQMDKYALVEEQKHFTAGQMPSLEAKQYGELTMAHEDCDTIPLLWNYAHHFTLFDGIFQHEVGPSTPGNISIIAAQSGETQYGLHPSEGYTDNGGSAAGVPVENDRDPAWGPYNPGDGATSASEQINLTFASLPLTTAGSAVTAARSADKSAATDFADVESDVTTIAKRDTQTGFGWFQEGYDKEPNVASAADSLENYVTHHNGPQYFGYVANSPIKKELHGLADLSTELARGTLPAGGGVFYAKGGYLNLYGIKPADPDSAVQSNFVGDDDHPGYSDAEISEANVAQLVNDIAASKYWSQSAIVITWDDSEGDWDHVAPPLTEIGPGTGNAPYDFTSDGPRVPLMVISPYAKTGYIGHGYGDQASVVKLVNTIFGLTPLAELPDEEQGTEDAASNGHNNFKPGDASSNGVNNLVDAFDPNKLSGATAPLPASYAMVPESMIKSLPQTTGLDCAKIGIVPVDESRGIKNEIPADFNPRPGTDPTDPNAKRVNGRQDVMRAADPED